MGRYIELVARDMHSFRAYVIEPLDAPKAALVLLQEMDQRAPGWQQSGARSVASAAKPGVNLQIRNFARQFASEGYLVICPSTFSRGESGTDYGYLYEPPSLGWGPRLIKPLDPLPSNEVLLDVQAAIDHVRGMSPRGRVGVVGYCWGGLLAWRAAARFSDLQAVVCFHGGGIGSEDDRDRTALMPVQAHLSTGDAFMDAASVQAFVKAQSTKEASGAPQPTIHLYDAPYGFTHPGRRNYNQSAALLAHRRSLKFLAEHLLTSPVSS